MPRIPFIEWNAIHIRLQYNTVHPFFQCHSSIYLQTGAKKRRPQAAASASERIILFFELRYPRQKLFHKVLRGGELAPLLLYNLFGSLGDEALIRELAFGALYLAFDPCTLLFEACELLFNIDELVQGNERVAHGGYDGLPAC